MYCLQNNVEIISGKKGYCIYDLNTKKLYHLDLSDKNILDQLTILDDIAKAEATDTGKYLIKNGIVVSQDDLLPRIAIPVFQFAPTFAWIEITQNCNLLCRHCYESSSRNERRPEMTFDHFIIAVDYLKKIGVDQIQLVGGEPLVHSRFEDFLDYTTGKFNLVEVYTNGTLLTNRLLEKLKACDVSLALSVYSEDPKQHDFVTQTPGSFALTFRHIQEALSLGISIRTASVEMKDTQSYTASSLNVSHRSDLPRLTGRADLSLYNKNMLMRKLITKENFKTPLVPEDYYRNHVLHNCFGERLYIDYMLNAYPCAMERRVCYGNILADPDGIMKADYPSMTKDKIDGCKDCEYRYACYDCRCDAMGAPIDAKPWYCTYDHVNGIWEDPELFAEKLLQKANQAQANK